MKNFNLKLAAPALLAFSSFASSQSFAWSTTCDVIGTSDDYYQLQHWWNITLAESNAGYSGLYAREKLTHSPSPIFNFGPFWQANTPNTAWGDGRNISLQGYLSYSFQFDGNVTAADANQNEVTSTKIECIPAFWG